LYELSNEYYYSANVSKYYRLCKISLTWGTQYETLHHTQHPDQQWAFPSILSLPDTVCLHPVCCMLPVRYPWSVMLLQVFVFMLQGIVFRHKITVFLLTRFNKCQDFISVPMLVVKLFHEHFFIALASLAVLSEWF
jgi:hypothetical protein